MKRTQTSLRQRKILDLLSGREEVSVAALAARFRVTAMTIRRDLDPLAQAGRITRTHGGALLAAPALVAFAFQERRQQRMKAKAAIGQVAAREVKPGMTVILDTGTTTLEVARLLGGIPRLKVLTNSLAIASELLAHGDLELVLLGGTVSAQSPDLSGSLTEDNLSAFRADLAIVGADAVDARGLYTSGQSIARVSRAMLRNAARTVLVADSSKFGKTAFVRIAGWDDIDLIVTDADLAPAARRWARQVVKGLAVGPDGIKDRS